MKRYLGYQCSGYRGSVYQLLINGTRYEYDTITGKGDRKEVAKFERILGDAICWVDKPLFGHRTQKEMEDYVGA